jgi:hypothetical protein
MIDLITKNKNIRINHNVDDEISLYFIHEEKVTPHILDEINMLCTNKMNVNIFVSEYRMYDTYKYMYTHVKYLEKDTIHTHDCIGIDMIQNIFHKSTMVFDPLQHRSLYHSLFTLLFYRKKYVNGMFSLLLLEKPTCIEKTLACLGQQSYQLFEIIIINDDPHDLEFEKTISNYSQILTHIPIMYIRNYQRQGIYISQNIGIMNSSGEYISKVFSGDEYPKDKLMQQYDIFQNTDSKKLRTETEETIHRDVCIENGLHSAFENEQNEKEYVYMNNFF